MRMPLAANAARNWVTSASVSTGSRHWFGVFVKTWIAVAPIATPRVGARATPPAVETWAPIGPAEPLCRFDEEVGEALDRGDAGARVGENRGLITGSGADLEHAVAAPRRERFGHECHDQRLGDRLAAADRQRRVLIRVGGEMGRQEPFARHPRHRREHPAIANPAARELAGHHAAARASRLTRGAAPLPPPPR